ncbi:Uma2 family endonuclease, partial [Spirulina subsalsa FACHB-351]|nr:Uma2 family endonuclease [Spirulina subsalsa FACHB-351]
ILSPSNTTTEMAAKQRFYEKYGVLEMYFYNPESYDFWGFERERIEESFRLITPLHLPWTSPLLNIRFELLGEGLVIYHPTGEPFKEPGELFTERNLAQQERDLAQQERDLAQQERDLAQQERDRALAKLRELGIDPETL